MLLMLRCCLLAAAVVRVAVFCCAGCVGRQSFALVFDLARCLIKSDRHACRHDKMDRCPISETMQIFVFPSSSFVWFSTHWASFVPPSHNTHPNATKSPGTQNSETSQPQACVMIGSVIFKLAMSLAPGTTAEKMCLWASAGGALCFFALALGLSRRGVQIALLGFELCVGVYLNAMGMMRSKYIPQEVS